MTAASTSLHIREHRYTVDRLKSLRAEFGAGTPAAPQPRWDEWTAEQQHAYQMHNVCDGLLYGLLGLRLSFAAETLLFGWPSLTDLCFEIHERLIENGSNFAIGFPGSELNAMARQVVYMMWAMAGGII